MNLRKRLQSPQHSVLPAPQRVPLENLCGRDLGDVSGGAFDVDCPFN